MTTPKQANGAQLMVVIDMNFVMFNKKIDKKFDLSYKFAFTFKYIINVALWQV